MIVDASPRRSAQPLQVVQDPSSERRTSPDELPVEQWESALEFGGALNWQSSFRLVDEDRSGQPR